MPTKYHDARGTATPRKQPAPTVIKKNANAPNSEPISKKKLGNGPTRQIDKKGNTATKNKPSHNQLPNDES
ncbi:hypothetical protein HMPREF0476_0175 [Kingella kingae ATCC 23330]|uniref:Uncharacterized protein n=1 Tax=Kingella kingae ATCC 23330 TaxID=887327 RepID=F5S4P2_KINKI|nr:hypothetical protein HMPREF0476_0175 [Kingella kingae ATCC 23330]